MKFYPISFATSIYGKNKATFHLPDKKVVIGAPRDAIATVLGACNGLTELSDVYKAIDTKKYDVRSIKLLVREMIANGVLVNAQCIESFCRPFVQNPSLFFNQLNNDEILALVQKAQSRLPASGEEHRVISDSGFMSMLNRRMSVRTFSKDGTVAADSLIGMLWSAYGITRRKNTIGDYRLDRRTVPSAGALYPLCVSLILLKDAGNIERGIYHVRYAPDRVLLDKIHDMHSSYYASFVDPLILRHAVGVIVLSGAYNVCGEKYTNRSLLYVPLEAGHAAQNVHIAASTLDIGTVEIGGFIEGNLAQAVSLPADYVPLTTILFGVPDSTPVAHPDIEFDWKSSTAGKSGYTPPFYLCFSRKTGWKEGEWSCGRSPDAKLAFEKALSEAIEWDSFKERSDTLIGRYSELQNACDPRTVVAYHPNQYRAKHFGLKPFREDALYSWVAVNEVNTGEKAYMHADLVFYPYEPAHERYAYANSSGCSAHQTKEAAIEDALYELIERDAFMIAWLTKSGFSSIQSKTLPVSIRDRVKSLQKLGYAVDIKVIDAGFQVMLVSAYSSAESVFTCAAAAGPIAEQTLSKALMEVESHLFCHHQGMNSKPAYKPRNVQFPEDHGNLYLHPRAIEQAQFLIKPTKNKISWGKGIEQHMHKPIITQLAEKGFKKVYVYDCTDHHSLMLDRHVVRVIVPGLVPISFGYGLEPLGLERLYQVSSKGYRQMNRFPHPFN